MAITAKQPETNYQICPAGNHIARCYQMIEIGTEANEYQGEVKRQYKVRVVWEIPNEKMVFDAAKGEQPFSIGKDYTLSMHEKSTLRHDLKSWRGKDFTEQEAKAFDITKLLGVACMLNVIHEPKKDGSGMRAKVAGISPLPKGMTAPAAVNPVFVFSFDDAEFDAKILALPEWLRNRIEQTPEFATRVSGPQLTAKPVAVDTNDDLPF